MNMFDAVKAGDIEALSRALQQGAHVDSKDGYNETPLIYAAQGTSVEIVMLLLDSGARVDHKGEDGWTPLFYAVNRDRADIAKLLIDRGANIDAVDKRGHTVFYLAVSKRNAVIVEYLAVRGVKVNTLTRGNSTPLIRAVATPDNLEMVKRLVAAGADVHLCPLDLFLNAVLRSAGGDGLEVLEFLKECGLEYFELDSKGNSIIEGLKLPIPGRVNTNETIEFLQNWR